MKNSTNSPPGPCRPLRPPDARRPLEPPDSPEVLWQEDSNEEEWRNEVGYTGRKPSLDDYDRWNR